MSYGEQGKSPTEDHLTKTQNHLGWNTWDHLAQTLCSRKVSQNRSFRIMSSQILNNTKNSFTNSWETYSNIWPPSQFKKNFFCSEEISGVHFVCTASQLTRKLGIMIN